MNGQLNVRRAGSTSRGPPALDFSMSQVKAMHSAAMSGHFFKADIDSSDAPMSQVGDYRMVPFAFLRDRPRVANLVPTEKTEAPTVFYFKGTTAASAAAPVAEAQPSRRAARCGRR
jgi:hypothetical protein